MGVNGNIIELETWKRGLGLLPVPLFDAPDTSNEKIFVLLNGMFGSFCLDLEGHPADKERSRNHAWSSDVGHYVNVLREEILVYRWDNPLRSETHPVGTVRNNLGTFYEYLRTSHPDRNLSIVSFALKKFRKFRSVLSKANVKDSKAALKVFLLLLACASERVSRSSLDITKWSIDARARDMAYSIRDGDWQSLIEDLLVGDPYYNLRPDIPLLLRHASGQLFQEAHYLAIVDDIHQMNLEGILPSPAKISRQSKEIGIYYTPPSLARSLVEEAFNAFENLPTTITIFDPACGSGEFLKEVLRFLLVHRYKGKIKLIGWDISQTAIDICSFILAREKQYWQGDLSIQLTCIDALDESSIWPDNIDIILMNPPFLSWQDMDSNLRDRVKAILGNLLTIKPDLSSVFMLKAAKSLNQNGVLANILPAAILEADSYAKFRNEFKAIMTPRLIGKLGSQTIFLNAIIDAAIYVGKRTSEKVIATSLWADYRPESFAATLRALRRYRYAQSPDTIVDEPSYSIYPDPKLGKTDDRWVARSYKSYKFYHQLEDMPRGKDIFSIRQGVRTGLKSAFVLDKSDFENLPRRERKYFCPAVVSKSIRNGYLSDVAYVFYPYRTTTSKIETETDLRTFLKTYYENYLKPHKQQLSARASKGRLNWWDLSRARSLQKKTFPKLVSTFFGKAGSFAWDGKGEYVVVQGHYWEPKLKGFSENTGLAYLAVLTSSLTDILLSYVSTYVGGGQWDLSNKFLQFMPLPDLSSSAIKSELFLELVNLGQLISSNENYDRNNLDEIVSSIYRLPRSLTK